MTNTDGAALLWLRLGGGDGEEFSAQCRLLLSVGGPCRRAQFGLPPGLVILRGQSQRRRYPCAQHAATHAADGTLKISFGELLPVEKW